MALAAVLLAAAAAHGQEAPPLPATLGGLPSVGPLPGSRPHLDAGGPVGHNNARLDGACLDGACLDGACLTNDDWNTAVAASENPWLLRMEDFFNRSPATHGRSVGFGEPLRGTSWLNRPWEVSYQFGAFIMPSAPAGGSRADNDIFGSLHLGRDFDHYWGVEFRLGGTTVEVNPSLAAGQQTSDTLTLIDLSTTYYPWGDSRTRPYLRLGAGLTDIEFTTAAGARQQASLFTVPVGIGIKHLAWRATALRAELTNNFAIGSSGADTMGNLTMTFGVEHRFGGVAPGYWAWKPQGRLGY